MRAAVFGSSGGRLERKMPLDAIGARLRAICLAFPEATEELAPKRFSKLLAWDEGLRLDGLQARRAL
jgi:hypothetical protein